MGPRHQPERIATDDALVRNRRSNYPAVLVAAMALAVLA